MISLQIRIWIAKLQSMERSYWFPLWKSIAKVELYCG
jgi:hypothetical protein